VRGEVSRGGPEQCFPPKIAAKSLICHRGTALRNHQFKVLRQTAGSRPALRYSQNKAYVTIGRLHRSNSYSDFLANRENADLKELTGLLQSANSSRHAHHQTYTRIKLAAIRTSLLKDKVTKQLVGQSAFFVVVKELRVQCVRHHLPAPLW